MTDKAMPITGGCLCGAVRYESSETPLRTLSALVAIARNRPVAHSWWQ